MGYLSIFLIVIASIGLNVVFYYKNKEIKKELEDYKIKLKIKEEEVIKLEKNASLLN